MTRFAAIDIGTVTVRMLVADVDDAGKLHELEHCYRIVNLGEEVDATGRLKPEAIERTICALKDYLAIRDSYANEPIATIACATSASRDAQNAQDFVDRLADIGITLSVIPGEREAELSFMGASADFPGEKIVVVDIGGGSTEIVAGVGGQCVAYAHSFQLGSRRITERFLKSDPPTLDEIESARVFVREEIQSYVKRVVADGYFERPAIAVAGTATSVVSVYDQMQVYDRTKVHLRHMGEQDLKDIVSRLASLTEEERRHVVGLDPDRAPVIVAGLIILEEIVKMSGQSGFIAGESDILQGMIMAEAQ